MNQEVESLLDSGAYDRVCSPEFANHSPLLPRLDTGMVSNADGSEMPTHGRRRVRLRLEGGQMASVEFQVHEREQVHFQHRASR